MNKLVKFLIVISLVFPSFQSSASSLARFSELLPNAAKNSVTWNNEMANTLRRQGFSDEAISFALRAADDMSDPQMVNQIAESIVRSSQSSVRQLAIASQNAAEISRILKREKYIDGTSVGALTAALLIGEGMYAYTKTRENFETAEDAFATNFARVALVSGFTTMGLQGMSSRRTVGKLGGVLALSLALYGVATGTSQIAIEQMNYATSQNIEEARTRLEELLSKEQQLVTEQREQRGALISERDALLTQRTELLSGGIPDNLVEERNRLRSEILRLENQLAAYEINVKDNATPAEKEIADRFRSEGLEYIGVNADGDASNDQLYSGTLLPTTEAALADARAQLEPILSEINQRNLNAGSEDNLSAAQKSRLEQIDSSIDTLSQQIDGLMGDTDAIVSIREAKNQATLFLAELETQGIGPDENLYNRLSQFINTEDGLRALITGTTFGLISVMGGVYLHKFIHILKNRGFIPESLSGSIRIGSINVSSLLDKNYVLRMEVELKSFNNVIQSAEGIDSVVRQAVQSEIRNFRQALNVAQEMRYIDADKVRSASAALTKAVDEVQPMLARSVNFARDLLDFLKFEKNLAGLAGLPVFRAAASAKKSAVLARMGANVNGTNLLVGGVVSTLILSMLASQGKAATTLMHQGVISEDGYDSYVADVQGPSRNILLGDAAVSLVGGVATIPITFISEAIVAGYMRDWTDKKVPYLSQSIVNTLSPSALMSDSISTDVVDGLSFHLPYETEGYPDELHKAIIAKNLMREFYRESDRPPIMIMAPAGIAAEVSEQEQRWRAQFEAYRGTYKSELIDLVSNPQNLTKYLDLFPIRERLELVRRLAASDSELLQDPGPYEEIAAYVEAYEESSLPGIFGTSADDQFFEDATLVNGYIMHRMGVEGPEVL